METPEPTAPEPENASPFARRQLALWLAAALAAIALLTLVLRWAPSRPIAFGPHGDSRAGEALFRAKGCSHCHRAHGAGGTVGPDLTGARLGERGRLLATMWNHAPQMLEATRSHELEYPTLTNEEAAHVSAFLSAHDAPSTGDPHP